MKTFPIGGVHPSDNKEWSKAKAIEPMELPDVVNIPLAQHIGAPATALVKKGDMVKVGEKIAEATGFMSANIHAPISGTVTAVDLQPNGQGLRQMMVTKLKEYISKQIDRGSSNVVQYEVEYHKRIATSFASFILTTIGVSLSSRKRKGGMGMYLGIGLALSFAYILLQTVSATFAINADTPPILAAWMPNIIFTVIAYFCYKKAPN